MAVKFLKRGAAAHKHIAHADKQTEEKKAAGGSPYGFRFYLPKGKETQITFLDGSLTSDGLLDTVTYWEHQLNLSGHWKNWFPCTQDTEVCPICETGQGGQPDTPALVAVFSILDHSVWTDKQGATRKNERRFYVCKRDTFKRLQKYATKRNGLAGCTFDVSRVGAKSENVGNDYDFVEKQTLEALAAKYNLKLSEVQPLNYEELIPYRDAEALKKMGFGSAVVAIGTEDGKEINYDQEL